MEPSEVELRMTDRRSPSWRHAILGLALLGAVAQAAVLRSGGRTHNNDFKHLWLGARILHEGGSPYDSDLMMTGARQHGFATVNPFVYLPATGLMLWPLAVLPFSAAELVWFVFNFALAWACVVLGPRLLRLPSPSLGFAAGAFFLLGAFPFYRQMTAGQMNVTILAALILAPALLMRGRDGAAGALIGLAAAFKIAPGLLILVLAAMRRWKAAGAAAAAFIAVSLVTLALDGAAVHTQALGMIREMGFGRSTWAEFGADFYRDPFNQSFNALFHHLLTENPHTTPWLKAGPRAANALTWAAAVGLVALLAMALRRYRRAPYFSAQWGEAETSLFLLASIVMLLAPSLMWDHYAVQALAALVWVFGATRFVRRPLTALAAVAVFFLLAYPWRHTADAFRSGLGIPLMSLRLWGMLGLLALMHEDFKTRLKERLEGN